MIGNDNLAKVDVITAYKLDPQSPELVPVLARLFPDASIPEVELYQHRFFPEIEQAEAAGRHSSRTQPRTKHRTLTDVQTKKKLEKKTELISIGEMRSYLMNQNIQPLPPIRSNIAVQHELGKGHDGWKQFNIGISNF